MWFASADVLMDTGYTGLAYQLGNLISAASSQIQATIGERYPMRNPDGSLLLRDGEPVPDYAYTQAIFLACVCAGLLICGKHYSFDIVFYVIRDIDACWLGFNSYRGQGRAK